MTAPGANVSGGGFGEQPGPVATTCYRHPNREALIRCTRCDRPICPDCMRPASVGFHCPDDVAMAAKTVRQPRTTVGATLRNSPPYVTGALIAINVVIYLIGIPWLMLAAGLSVSDGLKYGLWPFVVGDLVKLAVAACLLPIGWWLVRRRSSDL